MYSSVTLEPNTQISGVIQNQIGQLSYSVILADGCCVHRHVDHIISGVPDANKSSEFDDVPSPSAGTISQPSTSPPLSLDGLLGTDIHQTDTAPLETSCGGLL